MVYYTIILRLRGPLSATSWRFQKHVIHIIDQPQAHPVSLPARKVVDPAPHLPAACEAPSEFGGLISWISRYPWSILGRRSCARREVTDLRDTPCKSVTVNYCI